MEGERIKLMVMGLSYNQIQNGAYALILAEVNGKYRIPVVIGASEAQSIAVILERVVPPRPLTHDLFTSLGHAFGIRLKEVVIHKFEDGVFLSTITFTDADGNIVELDSRTSDAIAIALRMGAPIYTTREILEETGFILESKGPGKGIASGHNANGVTIEIQWEETGNKDTDEKTQRLHREEKLENYALEELERLLAEAVNNEEYERASKIRDIIEKKKLN